MEEFEALLKEYFSKFPDLSRAQQHRIRRAFLEDAASNVDELPNKEALKISIVAMTPPNEILKLLWTQSPTFKTKDQ